MSKVRYKRPKRGRPGRKVYRTRSGYGQRKRDVTSAVKLALKLLCLAALVFVGYSMGAPILNYMAEKKAEKNSISVVTSEEEEDGGYDERLPNAVTTSPEFDDVDTETAAVTDSAPVSGGISDIRGAAVETAAMGSLDLIGAQLDNIMAGGMNTAVFTLKDKGGDIYFNIASPFAAFAGGENIKSELYADEIASAARSRGLAAAARIDLLEDGSLYGNSAYGSYKTADGSVWKDAEGNSWLSPYDENTFDYIADITAEIAAAGFDYIIISGVRFPEFTSSDYEQLGEAMGYGGRYSALIRAANTVYKNAGACEVILEADAAELAAGKAEAVKPDELLFDNIAAVYGADSGTLPDVKGMKVIPVYSGGDHSGENCIIY